MNHGLLVMNEDDPERPINSGETNYKLTDSLRDILGQRDSTKREGMIREWLSSHKQIVEVVAESKGEVQVRRPDGSVKTVVRKRSRRIINPFGFILASSYKT
jgi:hypothetical protein